VRSCNFCLLTRKLGMRLGVPILSPNPKVLSFRTGGVGPEESAVLWSDNGACADLLRVHGEEEPLAYSRCLATEGTADSSCLASLARRNDKERGWVERVVAGSSFAQLSL
jgi:hypothetical protein